jgi:uncharacterized membrane protein YjjP (DUF1212 family)
MKRSTKQRLWSYVFAALSVIFMIDGKLDAAWAAFICGVVINASSEIIRAIEEAR